MGGSSESFMFIVTSLRSDIIYQQMGMSKNFGALFGGSPEEGFLKASGGVYKCYVSLYLNSLRGVI